MEPKNHWEKIYSERSATQVSWYQSEPALSLRLISATGLPKDSAIIDVGGGASTLGERLLADDYTNISVLDISGKALSHAQKRMGEKSASVSWLEADATRFDPPHKYDLWHDRAVFHFLTHASERKNYVDVLCRSLRKEGHLIIATFAIGGPLKCSGLDIIQYDSGKMNAELGDEFHLQSEQFEMHTTPAGGKQKFVYFHFVRTSRFH